MIVEQAPVTLKGRNPDVLTCIANLSNDEVFTPPRFRQQDTQHLGRSLGGQPLRSRYLGRQNRKISRSLHEVGVFLREITSRLTKGLQEEIPDLQERVDHILTQQVFGIGITRITSLLARRSLYCSKHAKGEHSIATSFESDEGNVWFERMEHTWEGNKCKLEEVP